MCVYILENYCIYLAVTCFCSLKEVSFVFTVILAGNGYFLIRQLIACKQKLFLIFVASSLVSLARFTVEISYQQQLKLKQSFLQVGAHVARLIFKEREGMEDPGVHHSIFFSVDLVSYTLLLFPIIW